MRYESNIPWEVTLNTINIEVRRFTYILTHIHTPTLSIQTLYTFSYYYDIVLELSSLPESYSYAGGALRTPPPVMHCFVGTPQQLHLHSVPIQPEREKSSKSEGLSIIIWR